MSDTQTWTSIIGMLTGMLTSMALVLVVFERAVNRRFQAVDEQFDGVYQRFDAVDQRLDRLEDRFERRFERIEERLEAGFARIGGRIDGLARDIALLVRRELGEQ